VQVTRSRRHRQPTEVNVAWDAGLAALICVVIATAAAAAAAFVALLHPLYSKQ